MPRRGPTDWMERLRSITPNTNATTPAAWPKPRMKGDAITAGAATVWMAACAPKGIVVRELLIRQADYERMCESSVSAVTYGQSLYKRPMGCAGEAAQRASRA